MSTVDEVKARLDIVDVVGGYVPLKKAGRYFKANCPFHNERTPSFVVYPDRQSWHCFGACGVGGDVISFVSRKENLDFQGALRLLAERAGVELRDDGPRRETVKTLQDANEAAALYFHGLLQNASTSAAGPAAAARAYAEERGLDRQAIADFQLGYAPPGWDHLRSHLMSRGFDEQKLIDAGLLIEREGGGQGRSSYDRFRERLIFPIRDDRGRVLGFGGRILPGSDIDGNNAGPKYMNTPQTPIFDKGSILYGLDRAKDEIRRNACSVIVEGYMDVIAAHQHGFKNVVASMGTALTDRQALLLQRFGERIVLAMDADEAGSAANLRGVLVVKAAAERSRPAPQRSEAGTGRGQRNLDLRVLTLPQGKDPDELIRHDPTAFSAAVESAKPVVEHLFTVMTAGRDLSQPETRSLLVGEVLPTIGEIGDPVVQAHYLQRLSRLARISEDSLRRQLPRRGRPEAPRGGRNAFERRAPESVTIEQLTAKVRRAPREEFCLALIYKAPELEAVARQAIRDELFSMSVNFELLRRWRNGETVTEADVEVWEHYQTVLQMDTPQIEMGKAQEALLSCVAGLENDRIRAVKEASALALVEGEAGVRPGYVASIAREWLEAGRSESEEPDSPEGAVATLLLEDTRVGLQLHAPAEGARSDQPTTTTGPLQ